MNRDTPTLLSQVMGMVPMVQTLNIEFIDFEPQRAVFQMADQAEFRDQTEGIDIGALFTLGETAAGALLFGNFGDYLDRVTPLMAGGTMTVDEVARGTITATATMVPTPAEILKQVDAGVRPEWSVDVTLADEHGTVTGRVVAAMTLRIN